MAKAERRHPTLKLLIKSEKLIDLSVDFTNSNSKQLACEMFVMVLIDLNFCSVHYP